MGFLAAVSFAFLEDAEGLRDAQPRAALSFRLSGLAAAPGNEGCRSDIGDAGSELSSYAAALTAEAGRFRLSSSSGLAERGIKSFSNGLMPSASAGPVNGP